jgi:hypothetical protein
MSKLFAAGIASVLATGVWIVAPVHAESVMKECGTEWKTAKANSATNGLTWQEFLKDCKTRHASTAGAAPVAASAPAPATPTPSVSAATPTPTPTRLAKVSPTATGAGEFANEGEAKGHCPTDTVVWVNTKSHKYHFAGHRSYGTTKQGAYMCEADAKTSGDVAAKGEKPKT